jgi:DNA polymerase III subunit delta
MSAEKIIIELKKKHYKPVYWLEGEEPFFIDEIVEYAEHKILSESEASFNLTIFYGKDTDWATVVNACKRYPMFAEKQVVIIKEAQQMKDIDKLESYIEHPLLSTILIISYKEKKLDARTKFAKTVKAKGELFSTKKMYDNQLPEWINSICFSNQLSINPKANAILVDNIGNDLSRIKTEIEKLIVNLGTRKTITEDDIETYIGVSKEYNIFELQDAVAKKNMAKALKIIQYFDKNPKAAPIQLILPALYSFFSKVFLVVGSNSNDEKTIAAMIGVNPYFVKDYLQAAKNYNYSGVEKILLLLHSYNLKSVGIGVANNNDTALMKEFIIKAIA